MRAAIFLGIFILYSGIIGPKIVASDLVNHNGFQIYGGAGKALLFASLALIVLIRRRGYGLKLKSWHPSLVVWLALSVISAAGVWFLAGKLAHGVSGVIWPISLHLCLLAGVGFALSGVFGPANIRLLAKTYKQDLLIALCLATLFYGFLALVYGLWEILAEIVLDAVSWLLQLAHIAVVIIPPRTLLFTTFGIDIAQYCSGVESIALFTALYALIGVLEWPRFNHRKFLVAFPVTLAVLFGCNILRVYGLILVGYYIDPTVALNLFHTYAGMVFFMLYSLLFWAISYKWMLRPSPQA
jgi:exosortase/archaeosortase family protein